MSSLGVRRSVRVRTRPIRGQERSQLAQHRRNARPRVARERLRARRAIDLHGLEQRQGHLRVPLRPRRQPGPVQRRICDARCERDRLEFGECLVHGYHCCRGAADIVLDCAQGWPVLTSV